MLIKPALNACGDDQLEIERLRKVIEEKNLEISKLKEIIKNQS